MPPRKEDYEILNTIGFGVFGRCQKIRRKSDGKVLVWKELDYGLMDDSQKQMIVSEVNLLRKLKHPNIVEYYGRVVDKNNSKLYIVMEHCEGGDLSSCIKQCITERQHLEERFILKILTQLTLALKECHSRSDGTTRVLHRDLKPANVFLDDRLNVKLGDFGMARTLNSGSFAKTFLGTPNYMSPELVDRTFYNEKADIWSLGCLVYELCALSPPFTAGNQRTLADRIREGRVRRIPSRYSDQLNTLISSMLNTKDFMRPSVGRILRSSLLSDVLAVEQRKLQLKPLSPHQKPVGATVGLALDLKLKEKALQDREQALKEREERLERREKQLNERELLSLQKLQRVESLLMKIKLQRQNF